MNKPVFTKKGWLGIAPIYADDTAQNIKARHPILNPLLTLSIWIVQFTNDTFDTEYPFPIKITGAKKR